MTMLSVRTEDVPKFFLFWTVEFEEKKKVFHALLRKRKRPQILDEQTEIGKGSTAEYHSRH